MEPETRGTLSGQTIPALRRTEHAPLEYSNDEKAKILAAKFFPGGGAADLSDITEIPTDERFEMSPAVSEKELREVLQRLPNGKAPGPDGIPNETLRSLADTVSADLADTISQIFEAGDLPATLKESTTVVLKKDKKKDYSLANSYRPIALENTLAKVIEKILATRITEEAENRGLIPWNQMGARKKRSTLSAIELLTGSIQTAWKAKKSIVSVLGLDLAGAFDNVSHERLLWTLQRKGFPEWVVKTVRSFLANRRTKLAFGDFESEWITTQTGIPQGSTLSPVLFLFFISDLLEQFQEVKDDTFGFGFVDDTTLITWSDSAEANCRRLTQAHEKCEAWAKRYGAKFAPDKYQLIHFTKRRKNVDLTPTVTISGHEAELVTSLRGSRGLAGPYTLLEGPHREGHSERHRCIRLYG